LLHTQDLLENWIACQSTWQYLEPIFSSPDILKQMPEEGDKFRQVDSTWRDLMDEAQTSPNVLKLASDPEKLARLYEANKLLEEVQKVCQHQIVLQHTQLHNVSCALDACTESAAQTVHSLANCQLMSQSPQQS
jgi:Dynein heavy chain, N-terminal region 2